MAELIVGLFFFTLIVILWLCIWIIGQLGYRLLRRFMPPNDRHIRSTENS